MKNVLEPTLNKQEELKIELDLYTPENIPDEKRAEEMSTIFLNNYPTMYSDELRESDLERYDSPEKIQEQVENGNLFITATSDNKIIGLLKFRKERRTEDPDCEEWLGSWVMVDKSHRNSGVAEKLFKKNLEILSQMKNSSNKKIFFVADVNKENKASIDLCEKLGCKKMPGKSKEYFLFRKEILEN